MCRSRKTRRKRKMAITDREADLLRLRSEWERSISASADSLRRLMDIGVSFLRENGNTSVQTAAERREEGLQLADRIISVFKRQQDGLKIHLARWAEDDELRASVQDLLETVDETVVDLMERRRDIEAIDPGDFASGRRAPASVG